MTTQRKWALVIGIIVVFAETVIVYDLWKVGGWFTLSELSAFKTAAFVLLFVGSLIAEMQDLAPRVRVLLFVAVLLLAFYQGLVNVVENFNSGSVPAGASAFFAPLGVSPDNVKWYGSVIDALVRQGVVVLMWLVTGLVWRGMATAPVKPVTDVERMLEYYRTRPRATLTDAGESCGHNRQWVKRQLDVLEREGAIHRNGNGVTVLEH